jgi:hypothetical protein
VVLKVMQLLAEVPGFAITLELEKAKAIAATNRKNSFLILTLPGCIIVLPSSQILSDYKQLNGKYRLGKLFQQARNKALPFKKNVINNHVLFFDAGHEFPYRFLDDLENT